MSGTRSRGALRIGIYCDMGPQLGAGHFMRSVSIGAVLVRFGAHVDLVGDLDSIPWTSTVADSYGVEAVRGADVGMFTELARQRRWDAAVVDSYIATASDLAELTIPLLALDDQAIRSLPARVVVNPNLSATGVDYGGWPTETVLRGPAFASLRPELTVARQTQYRNRDWADRQQNVLIVCGGTDAGDGAVTLTRLALAGLPRVNVRVIAAGQTTADRLAELAVPQESTVDVLRTTMGMAELMDWADLAITTAGSTVWELCCLGTPMALVRVADNQLEHYQAALDAGIGIGLGSLVELRQRELLPAAEQLGSAAALNTYGERAWRAVDGLGAARIADSVLALASAVILRPAQQADAGILLDWRNDPATRQASRNTGEVSPQDHQRWFDASLMNPDRLLLVAELHGKAVGMLRYDRLDGNNRWEVSINLSPAHRGLGLAASIVRVGHLWLRQRFGRATLVAETRASNEAMLRTFARCGYREISRDQAWVELELTL